MSSSKHFKVLSLAGFEKSLAKIISNYPKFRKDIEAFKERLITDLEQGVHLGGGIYKVRLDISGKPAGKSYGARSIHVVFSVFSEVLLIRIYDKSDKHDLSISDMTEIRKMVNLIRKLRKPKS
jgi:hypothetical protein